MTSSYTNIEISSNTVGDYQLSYGVYSIKENNKKIFVYSCNLFPVKPNEITLDDGRFKFYNPSTRNYEITIQRWESLESMQRKFKELERLVDWCADNANYFNSTWCFAVEAPTTFSQSVQWFFSSSEMAIVFKLHFSN